MSLSVPARTALAHIEKADKLVKEAADLRAQAEKADRLEAKAEDHYKAAGLILAKIKAAHDTSRDGAWKKVCKAKCGLSWQRVYELIDLAGGRASLTDQRERKAASQPTTRAARGERSATRGRVADHEPQRRLSAPVKPSACDYDWSKPDPADFGDPSEMYGKQADHYFHEALHLAESLPILSDGVDPKVIRSKISAAQAVADAWLRVVSQLKSRAKQG